MAIVILGHAAPPRFPGPRPLPRRRHDPGPRRPDRGAPARRLGRRCDPGADARAHARRRHARRTGRFRLPVYASQQALDYAELEGTAGHRRAEEVGGDGRRPARELSPRREGSPRHRLRGALEDQSAARLREHLGIRADGALCGTPRLRPDRAGHGRPHVGDGPAGPGAGARGDRDRRPRRRNLRPLRRHRPPPRARGLRQGAVAAHLAPGSADLHDGFPDCALDDRWRDPRAGGQLPPDQHPHRGLSHEGRLHQHRGLRRQDLGALLRSDGRAGMDRGRALSDQERTLGASRLVERRDREEARREHQRPLDRRAQCDGCRVRADQQPEGSFRGAAGEAPGQGEEGRLGAAGRAGPDGTAGDARAHALDHRARRAAARRAYGGDPGRDRLRSRGAEAAQGRGSLLMNDMAYVSGTERVKTWLEGSALHVRFNNPEKHNALSVDMWEAVPPLLDKAAKDDNVRMVVLSGEGGKSFISGADISQFEDLRAAKEAVKRYEALAEAALQGIYEFEKPTLACIRGYCIGGGVNVAISCDIRMASTDSAFAIPAARLGLGYRYSAMKYLVDLIGPGAAKDLFYTARRIDASEAKSLGLVSRICAPEALAALLAEYTSALADNAPLTVAAAKAIMREILKPSSELDTALCASLIRACFESADYTEGRTAFMQKRKPVFTGR